MRYLATALLALFLASCGVIRNGGGLIPPRAIPNESGSITILEPGKKAVRVYIGEDAVKNAQEDAKRSY